jgi:hypothetical protein
MLERILHLSHKIQLRGALRSAVARDRAQMDTNQISLSAIKQLYEELDRSVQQAKMEIGDRRTRPLGELRLDLAGECRRRLEFLSYMAKDAHEHANERWHARDGED